jgi:hypothetical protein
VNLHDFNTRLFVWEWQLNLSIESSGSEQGGVQNVRPVSRSDHFDVVVLREAI